MSPQLTGRAKHAAALTRALDGVRWVTVVGPPGVGKTALVRHVLADRDDVRWADARQARDLDDLVPQLVEILGAAVLPGESPASALARAFDMNVVCLVVDGVAPDLDGFGDLLVETIQATSGSTVLITATAASGKPAERVVRLRPLDLPPPSGPPSGAAYDLLCRRIEASGGVVREPDDIPALRRLTLASGGLPLVIEQLAVQAALLGAVNVAPAATAHDVVAASYELLPGELRQAMRRVAHLPQNVSLPVISAVLGVPVGEASRLTRELVRHSMLELRNGGRFGMLEPIRTYAADRPEAVRDAEAVRDGMLRWAEGVVPQDMNEGSANEPWLADLPVMRAAVRAAAATPETVDRAFLLANRCFSTLYTAMRAREAGELLEIALAAGDGPAPVAAQVARRAGIVATEVRGTYGGLPLIDRSDQLAAASPDPAQEYARNACIRAEIHLDAGELDEAETVGREILRQFDVDEEASWQAERTILDVLVSRGDLEAALAAADRFGNGTPDWIALSAATQRGRVALEQGRLVEATSTARVVADRAAALGEDRIGLLADVLCRQADPAASAARVDPEVLPWAVRLAVLLEDARGQWHLGDLDRAAGLAADVVVLADEASLGRDGVGARLLLAEVLVEQGDEDQAAAIYLAALDRAVAAPMALRVADALDGLAGISARRGRPVATALAATATALRRPRRAVSWQVPPARREWRADHGIPMAETRVSADAVPDGWVTAARLTSRGLDEVSKGFDPTPAEAAEPDSPLAALTKTERVVAELVAVGKTNREIAADLFVSPRTVDAHLSHIYRKLDISTRARLAALMVASQAPATHLRIVGGADR